MNAYELADELETLHWLEGDGSFANCPFQAQATMLRQQADRIAELEKTMGERLNDLNTRQVEDARTSLVSTHPMLMQ